MLLTKKALYKNRQKGKVTNIAGIKCELDQCSYSMNSIMPRLRENLQYLNKDDQI